MQRFFVTGGAGFVGSSFIRLLLKAYPQAEVINFDALTYAGNLDNLNGLDTPRHRFARGDVAERESVRAALPENAEAIFHLAAESHVDRSILAADEFIRTNILGTQVLLDVARERGARRFVHVSTDEVMGSLPDDDTAFFNEDSPFAPNSPYAASKAAAEHLVRAARHTHGLDTVITRCGNNYGPRQFPEKLIPLFIANALNDEPLPVYGDGKYTRDWIYVEDHARGILAAYEKGRAGDTYNFGARNARPNLDVIYSLLDTLGKPRSLVRYVKDRPGHDRRYAIDPAKAETDLGWKPQVQWEQGLAMTVKWYADNQAWMERCRNGEYRAFYRQQYGG
jgi:dTDP-glucose 4,6-dehydratase